MRRRSRSLTGLLATSLLLALLPFTTASAQSAPDPAVAPVISQVYGGGGNAGAPFTHDFVELFNPGTEPVDLDGWSVQYTSATGSGNWQVTALGEVTIAPGSYLLVQQAQGSNPGTPLPAPDVVGTIAMSATNGKVALVAATTPLSGNGCPPGETTVDLVGFGSADCYEGSGATGVLSNTTAALRGDGGCVDTDDNAADFIVATPTPRHSASPAAPCADSARPTADCPATIVTEGQQRTVTLTATDVDGTMVDATLDDTAPDAVSLGTVEPASEVGGTLRVELTATPAVGADDLTATVAFVNDDASPQSVECTVTITVRVDLCPVTELTPIAEIQGVGPGVATSGTVTTRGVVTADFTSGGVSGLPNDQGMRGFTIESIAADRDDDPATSEGIFVFDGAGAFDGEVGDLVVVRGNANEFNGVNQISASNLTTCEAGELDTELPPPAALPLPMSPEDRDEELHALQSMRVTHPELTVVEFFQIERFGELRLSAAGPLPNPTNVVAPDTAAYDELEAANAANTIILDDGRTGQNLDPLPYVVPGDTLRIGDQLRDHPTVLHYAFGAWRLQPVDVDAITEELRTNRTRPRPETAPDVGGTLTIAAFNVLNYFNGDGFFVGDDPASAAGFPTSRGARSVSEFERQTEKIVEAIVAMDADVLGLVEIENDEGDDQAAAALVAAVNAELDDEVYAYVDTGTIGTDEIKLAYLYQLDTVEPVGDHALLDGSVDDRFDDQRSRPALAQTFRELATGETVTVVNNHLKSKGSSCGEGDDHPQQGSCNLTRTRAAEAMVDWLAGDPTGEEATGTLVIGDLNSYAMEDPIQVFLEAGYTDTLAAFAPDGEMPYTYTFDATQGYLDHSLADADLLPHVTGAAAWNINADEVPAIDYLESGHGRFRTADVAERFYDDSAFRSSDHDPTLVGLDLVGDVPPPVEDPVLTCPPGTGTGFPDVPSDSVHADAIRCGDDLEVFAGKTDGRFDPRGSLTRGQVASVLDRIASALGRPIGGDRRTFADVDGAYVHADAIERLGGEGVIAGYPDGTFRPQVPIDRDQLASLVVRFVETTAEVELPLGAPFTDVPVDSLHAEPLRKARGAGILIGDEQGRAEPRREIRRDQAASLFIRSLAWLPVAAD